MDTIHTTNAVEFVDWRAKAKTKLEDENKAFKGSREARAVRDYILKTLICFADQEPRFAEVICNTKRTFSECCAAVVHNAGGMISDLDAYRRAVQFYFPHAEVEFMMNVKLTGSAPTKEEMQSPAKIKPEEASSTPSASKPAAKSEPKRALKKRQLDKKRDPKAKKVKKLAPKQEEDFMQLSLWG